MSFFFGRVRTSPRTKATSMCIQSIFSPLNNETSLKIVALIPAYNEDKNIRNVIESTQPYVDRVVVCDDGSSDDIQTVLDTIDVDIIKHSINLGYGAALKSLFKHGKEINATGGYLR